MSRQGSSSMLKNRGVVVGVQSVPGTSVMSAQDGQPPSCE